MVIVLPTITWEGREMKRRGIEGDYLEKVCRQIISSRSHRDMRASALPVAKYRPLESNSIQIQLEE